MLSFICVRAMLFAKIFLKNFHIDDSVIPICVSPCRANLKLHIISLTLKLIKKFITNLDSSKPPACDCIPGAVLKNCEPKLLYILADRIYYNEYYFLNLSLREFCFPYCWKVICDACDESHLVWG